MYVDEILLGFEYHEWSIVGEDDGQGVSEEKRTKNRFT